MKKQSFKQLRLSFLFLFMIVVTGTLGYMFLENWSLLDSLYMTVITMTTTGYEEVHQLSNEGRIFTIVLIILGVMSLAYVGGRAIQVLFENQIFRRRRMSKEISSLKDHYIVCGYGRMGKYICEELEAEKAKFVVIDNDISKTELLNELGYMYVQGDSTSDAVLLEAGVKQAKGLVAVLSNDAENVFTTLSAKVLNPGLYVVARAIADETESKLRKAGADKVVKPYETSGTRMAALLLRPGVTDFIDVVARGKGIDLNIEEISVDVKSELIDKALADTFIRKELNVIIVAINKAKDNRFIYNPGPSTKIEAGDKLIALGEKNSLTKLQDLCLG